LTTQLDNKNIEEIIKFNYTIEEQNQVGLCLPFNLVIVPFSFFLKVFTNKFDSELNKYIDDIIKANESHQKRTNIYINFKDASSSGKPHYWEDENIKNKSLDNLENILFTKEYSHAKHIYLNC
jgi:hypothetical protein